MIANASTLVADDQKVSNTTQISFSIHSHQVLVPLDPSYDPNNQIKMLTKTK
jgi:hypothetical protein